jgi:hypothetical protein
LAETPAAASPQKPAPKQSQVVKIVGSKTFFIFIRNLLCFSDGSALKFEAGIGLGALLCTQGFG